MSYIIAIYIILVLISSIINKNNAYLSFIKGTKEGISTVVGMYSVILVFMIAINSLINCGIIDDLKLLFNNSGIILIIIQMIIKPFSSNSSLSIMLDIYNQYGANCFISILSTFIHSSFDTFFYILSLYLGVSNTSNNKKIIIYGLFIMLFSYILIFITVYLFF